MAEIRLTYPDAPLRELGEYLDPPVGKSGVNLSLIHIWKLWANHQPQGCKINSGGWPVPGGLDMSFSGEVKEELQKQVAAARHCQIAELASIRCV